MRGIIQAIEKHSLLKTAQQIRNVEMEKSLNFLPKTLVELVGDYVEPEQCLQPLALNQIGDVLASEANTPIRQAIFSAFSASDINSELFRKNIIKTHHRHVLNQVFSDGLELNQTSPVSRHTIRSENEQARQSIKEQLLAIHNYQPEFRYQKTIQHKIAQAEKLHPGKYSADKLADMLAGKLADKTEDARLENIGQPESDIQLLAECAGNSDPALSAHILASELRKYALQDLNEKVESAAKKRDFISAQRSIMTAFELYCAQGNKRLAIRMVLRFIQFSIQSKADNFQEIIRLVESIKALSLSYPPDTDIYADLLFHLSEFAKKQSERTAVMDLLQESCLTMNLPERYRAMNAQGFACQSYSVSPLAFQSFEHLTNAIAYFHRIINLNPQNNPEPTRYDHEKTFFTEPKDIRFRVVSINKLLIVLSRLYYFAGRSLENQLNEDPQLFPHHRFKICALLDTINMNRDNELNYDIEEDQFLPLKHTTQQRIDSNSPRAGQQLVFAIANFYKTSLKILFCEIYDENREAENPSNQEKYKSRLDSAISPIPASNIGKLFQLYVKHNLNGELHKLMGEKFRVAISQNFPDVGRKLDSLIKSFHDQNKTQNQYGESDRKRYNGKQERKPK